MTFLAALCHDQIDAPRFIEGPIDGESFRPYIEKILLPTLRPDNLGSHKRQNRAPANSLRRPQAAGETVQAFAPEE